MRVNKTYPKGYYHTGTDILASLNTPLKSMLCGEVTEAYNTEEIWVILLLLNLRIKTEISFGLGIVI